MNKNSTRLIYILLFISNPVFADLISVSNNSAQIAPQPRQWEFNNQFANIIDPPPSTLSYSDNTEAMVGFDEKQNIMLHSPLEVDGEKFLDSGSVVSSHLVFLKKDSQGGILKHENVKWIFDDTILGVISDTKGTLLFQSSPLLGSEATLYHPPDTLIQFYGLEMNRNDNYSVNGNMLNITMTTAYRGPGDWVRVITQGDNTAIPEPTTLFLILFCLPLIAFKKRNKH